MILSFGSVIPVCEPPDPLGPAGRIESLFSAWIVETTVHLESAQLYRRVDAFCLLHELLNLLAALPDVEEFTLTVGEDVELVGGKSDGEFRLDLVDDGIRQSETTLTPAELLLSLAEAVVDLSRSLTGAGIDIPPFLRKFPPRLWL